MPIPQESLFSCGVGVPPAQKFDEKDFCKRHHELAFTNVAMKISLPHSRLSR
jgi:hypothetical protein